MKTSLPFWKDKKRPSKSLSIWTLKVILKDKFLSQCTSDIRIKLQQLQQQDPAASLDEMVQTATKTFYNRNQEREAKAQEREKRKEACPDAGCPPEKSYNKPRVLKEQGTRQRPNL